MDEFSEKDSYYEQNNLANKNLIYNELNNGMQNSSSNANEINSKQFNLMSFEKSIWHK